MIDKEISNLKAIDTLIRQEQPLAVYRIPGEDTPRLLTQASGSVRLLYDLKDLDGARGFVIAPFRASESCPIVLIQPEQWGQPLPLGEYAEEELEAFRLRQGRETFSEACTEEYEACFRTFIEALRSKQFDKLVLSRKSVIGQCPGFSPSAVFRAACKHYIHSYIYLCYTPRTGVWMGSTPEIILSGEKNEWSTVALAGTFAGWQTAAGMGREEPAGAGLCGVLYPSAASVIGHSSHGERSVSRLCRSTVAPENEFPFHLER